MFKSHLSCPEPHGITSPEWQDFRENNERKKFQLTLEIENRKKEGSQRKIRKTPKKSETTK